MTCPVLVYSAAIAGVALNGMYLLNVYLIFKVLEVFALTNQLGKFFRFERNKFGFFQKFFWPPFKYKKPISHGRDVIGAEIKKSPLTRNQRA